ncbi:hypothetical protein D3C71_1918310 [compost metagenome]
MTLRPARRDRAPGKPACTGPTASSGDNKGGTQAQSAPKAVSRSGHGAWPSAAAARRAMDTVSLAALPVRRKFR